MLYKLSAQKSLDKDGQSVNRQSCETEPQPRTIVAQPSLNLILGAPNFQAPFSTTYHFKASAKAQEGNL